MFKWCVVRCGSKNGYQKDAFKRDWTMESTSVNHSRLNSQHNWGPTWLFYGYDTLDFEKS